MMYYRGPVPYADSRFFWGFGAPLVGGFFGGLIGGGIAGGLVSAFTRPRPIIAYPPMAPYGYGAVPPPGPYGYGAAPAQAPYGYGGNVGTGGYSPYNY
ncbi:hypothetical protein KHA96_21450 [Bacillus sp. FJAT-49711]|uniref:hypothetical protein n=1 Tax=Bacillus sp. FJAT-49711 TaxID=2833585 RepID=UPI001BC8EE77|nr:hypothetical protein [Bacillus sp. FJAT-49711]MBS4220868.1 hypothetical protein [Bacillus sp. FJAT-49711]